MVLDVSHVAIYILLLVLIQLMIMCLACFTLYVKLINLKRLKKRNMITLNTGKSTSKSTEKPTKTTSESTKRPRGRPRKYPVTCSDHLRPLNSCKENSGNLIRSDICTIGINIHITHGSL